MSAIETLKSTLAGIRIEDNPAIVKQKSRDFYWYSPILKRQLDHVSADLFVSPKSEDEVVRVVKAAFEANVPITPRGTGTGNYGQAMPLAGGIVLSLADMNAVKSIRKGVVVAEAGAIIHDICEATRAHSGQELRLWPSTAKTATIGGFIAGGSGGVGSIAWGGLRDAGNILRCRAVTMEAEPRILDLTGDDLTKVNHAYGTTGIITEVEMPLTVAADWVDVFAAFDDVMTAVRCADRVARMDGLEKKQLAVIGGPAPHQYFLRHRKYVAETDSVIAAMIAPEAVADFARVVERMGGRLAFRSDSASEEEAKGLPPSYELCWNHTTLRALRVDPSVTYLQILFPAPNHVSLVQKMAEIFGDEVPVHLEFVRFDGEVLCFGLHLVRYTTDARLEEIVRIFEENGCPIFNPHRYTLEEGGMKQTDQVQLAFKREADPKGLLNPGKMVAWEDPNYDFASGKVFLFRGIEEGVGA
jgi:FAD/FMN-containing dehydrogenase